jgi:hypothetical protein
VIDRLRKWFGASPSEPTGPPAVAVRLPSGGVLVFDRAGHALAQARAPFDEIKDSVARDLGSAGQFFRISAEKRAEWLQTGSDDWVTEIQVEFTAIEHTVDAWLTGGLEGQPGGRATYVVDPKHALVLSPDMVWALIREAALRPRR